MIEVLLDCPRCHRLSRVELPGPRTCGHGTVITPSNATNLLQCVCGMYLDDSHIADPDLLTKAVNKKEA